MIVNPNAAHLGRRSLRRDPAVSKDADPVKAKLAVHGSHLGGSLSNTRDL